MSDLTEKELESEMGLLREITIRGLPSYPMELDRWEQYILAARERNALRTIGAAEEKLLPDSEGWWTEWNAESREWIFMEVSRIQGSLLLTRFKPYDTPLPGRWRKALSPDQEDALRAEVESLKQWLAESREAVSKILEEHIYAYQCGGKFTRYDGSEILRELDSLRERIGAALTAGKTEDPPSRLPDDVWKDAPEWANWHATDADGDQHWFEEEPLFNKLEDLWEPRMGKCELAGTTAFTDYWHDSLCHRPEGGQP